jgi:hypothetical protein
MYEVIRWSSIVLMWIATGMNIYAMVRLNQSRKHYEKKEKQVDALEEYYNTMIAACTEFLEAAHKKSEEAVE